MACLEMPTNQIFVSSTSLMIFVPINWMPHCRTVPFAKVGYLFVAIRCSEQKVSIFWCCVSVDLSDGWFEGWFQMKTPKLENDTLHSTPSWLAFSTSIEHTNFLFIDKWRAVGVFCWRIIKDCPQFYCISCKSFDTEAALRCNPQILSYEGFQVPTLAYHACSHLPQPDAAAINQRNVPDIWQS